MSDAEMPTEFTPDRINALIRNGRTTWFGLLSYLGFSLITLLGVRDADFFIPTQETALPLVGVTVPTAYFFAAAPILGAALHTYLHFTLTDLWRALHEAPAQPGGKPLAEQISPWLICDMALARRSDGAYRPRPLGGLGTFVAGFLVFTATPLLLFAFWWRSMPAHNEALTVLAIGLPASIAAFASWLSHRQLRSIATDISPTTEALSGKARWATGAAFLAVALIGWFRTEGTLGHYAYLVSGDRNFYEKPWAGTPFPNILAQANLQHANFTSLPKDWIHRTRSEALFVETRCLNLGVPTDACRLDTDAKSERRQIQDLVLGKWCEVRRLDQNQCVRYLDSELRQARQDWIYQRDNTLGAIVTVDMKNADLRRADLTFSTLIGVDLRGARLQGSIADDILLEGAVLNDTDWTGASLDFAILDRTTWDGAKLTDASLIGASLRDAYIDRVDLSGTTMIGVYLDRSTLSGVSMDEATKLFPNQIREAGLKNVDLSDFALSQVDLEAVLGDASVVIPEELRRPWHWPSDDLSWGHFQLEAETWRLNPDAYVPPQRR